MKKIFTFILLLGLLVSLSACGKVEITMQEIYDANQPEPLLANHQSVFVREEMDGEIWTEVYLTKDYIYNYIPDEEFAWVEFMTDDACYYYVGDERFLYLFITPDGVSNFANDRVERHALVGQSVDVLDETIASVSKENGRLTVKSFLGQDVLATMADYGVAAGNFEYVLDAKTYEVISRLNAYTYDDGEVFQTITKTTYDVEAPETVKEFLGYVNQTENLRNITVVSNPGTQKEESKSVKTPKGLIIGFQFDEDLPYVTEFYTDAACTEAYDPYADTDSDLTIYVKWTE